MEGAKEAILLQDYRYVRTPTKSFRTPVAVAATKAILALPLFLSFGARAPRERYSPRNNIPRDAFQGE